MEKKRNKFMDMVVAGFALFSIFFGAGNLLFPTPLGVTQGSGWLKTVLGFLVSDPVLPIMGILAVLAVGGKSENLGIRLHPMIPKIMGVLAIIIIGPLFAVPRTSAGTYDVAIKTNFPSVPLWIASLVFFIITYLLVVNETGVVDALGKYLTPALILVLVVIIVGAAVNPVGPVKVLPTDKSFLRGFTEGYQTLDAIGAPLMVGIVLKDLLNKGYKTRKEQLPVAFGASVVTFILLGFIYGGLIFVGSTASSVMDTTLSNGEILIGTVSKILGNAGSIILGLAMGLACLTTSVGLCSIFADFFSNLSGGKLKYKHLVIFAVVFSYFVSLLGTNQIIKIAVPVLIFLCPLFVVLFVLALVDKYIKYDLTYVGAFIGAIVAVVPMTIDVLLSFFNKKPVFATVLEKFPLGKLGFPWVVTAVIGAVIFTLIAVAMKDKVTTRDMHSELTVLE